MKDNYKIYIHIFPNGKVYIGITKMPIAKRFLNGNGYRNNKYMENAIKKYGWENVRHEILYEGLTKEEAEQKEIKLISEYKSNQKDFGYNIENGGNSTGKLSEETKLKLSLLNKGKLLGNKNGMFGKHHTEETKEKIRQALKGRTPWNKGLKNCFSKETKLKMTEHFKDENKEKIRILKMKETKTKKGQIYSTEDERHKARLESVKKYKENHKKEISEYNKNYRLNHKK